MICILTGPHSVHNDRSWTLPIVTNVPWIGPFELNAKPVDGNVSNQTLYSEEWISGATRWDWRAESGDWRFLSIEWPEEWATGGTAVIDVDWDDNPYTDIDVLWLSETPMATPARTPLPWQLDILHRREIDEQLRWFGLKQLGHTWVALEKSSRCPSRPVYTNLPSIPPYMASILTITL